MRALLPAFLVFVCGAQAGTARAQSFEDLDRAAGALAGKLMSAWNALPSSGAARTLAVPDFEPLGDSEAGRMLARAGHLLLTRHLSSAGAFQVFHVSRPEDAFAAGAATPTRTAGPGPDLVALGSMVKLGRRMILVGRLVDARTRTLLAMAHEGFEVPEEAPGPQRTAAAPDIPGRKRLWLSGAAFLRELNDLGPHAGLAVRSASQRWELGAAFERFSRRYVGVNSASDFYKLIRVRSYRLTLGYSREYDRIGIPAFLLAPFKFRLRLAAGAALHHLRYEESWTEVSSTGGMMPMPVRTKRESFHESFIAWPTAELGFSRRLLERLELQAAGAYTYQPKAIVPEALAYGGFAARVGLAWRAF